MKAKPVISAIQRSSLVSTTEYGAKDDVGRDLEPFFTPPRNLIKPGSDKGRDQRKARGQRIDEIEHVVGGQEPQHQPTGNGVEATKEQAIRGGRLKITQPRTKGVGQIVGANVADHRLELVATVRFAVLLQPPLLRH